MKPDVESILKEKVSWWKSEYNAMKKSRWEMEKEVLTQITEMKRVIRLLKKYEKEHKKKVSCAMIRAAIIILETEVKR